MVNIGACILEPQVLDYIPHGESVSIERQTFPQMIRDNLPVFGYQAMDYWLDIGTPQKYLKAHANILSGILNTRIDGEKRADKFWVGEGSHIGKNVSIRGPVVIGKNCNVGNGTLIIGPTVIGDNVQIGDEVFIEKSVIWNNALLETRASMVETIVGSAAHLKEDATLKEGCVVEDRYVVHSDRIYINDTILSHE